jgi:hypothetical protein
MDNDLKLILYVVIAIIWLIYNNYKKVSEASKKRDISKPPDQPGEVIPEAWPSTAPPEKKVMEKSGRPVPKPQASRPLSTISEERKKIIKARPERKQRRGSPDPFFSTIEGGNIQPSKIVQFEESEAAKWSENNLAEEIRNADFRKAIILKEVLQRPYN